MKIINKILVVMILLFPMAILFVKMIDPIIFYLLTFAGIYITVREKTVGFFIPELRLYSWLTLGFFVTMLISVLVSNEPTNSWTHLSRIAHFLVAPFFILVLYRIRVSFDGILFSVKIGAILTGIIAIGGYILADGSGRFSGMYNANTFGDIATIMTIFTIINVKIESKKEFIFTLVSLSFGVAAVSFSGSRGSMLSLTFLLAIYMIIQRKTPDGRYVRAIISSVVAMIILIIVAFGINNVQDRIGAAKSEISSWEIGENKSTSVGLRLEMYRAGVQAFLDSPLLGYGYHNATTVASRYANPKEAGNIIASFWHLHNEFLTTAVNAGLLGLLSLMLLYLLPLRIFWRGLKDRSVSPYASMGFFLISGYMFLGITHGEFGYEYETMWFVFFLGYTMIGVLSKSRDAFEINTSNQSNSNLGIEMSIVRMSFYAASYIFILNLVNNKEISHILLSIWPLILLFSMFLLVGLLPRQFFKLFLAFDILITSIAIFFKWRYGVTITEDILLSGMINDLSLTAEMISIALIEWILVTAIVPIWFIFLVRVVCKSWKKLFLILLFSIALTTVIILLQGYKYRGKGQIRDPKLAQAISCLSPIDVEYNFKKALKAYRNIDNQYSNIKVLSKKYHYSTKVEDLLVVFVLGESTRGDHFGINGYSKNTTTNLAKQSNIISFVGAKSCDTITNRSTICMVSPMLSSEIGREPDKSAFSEIMISLGFRTEIYSLQTLNEFYHYLGYDKLVSKYAILDKTDTGAKDVSLLPFASKAINKYTSGKKLIIVHTLGSHQTYGDRIMPSQEKFRPVCKSVDVHQCIHDEIINSYDNTIVAIDDFLNTIIENLKGKKALLIYLSDHGESLGESGVYFHGMPKSTAPKEQLDIPFIVWFSDKYINSEEGKRRYENLKQHASDLVSHDNLFHSILGCTGIVSNDGGIDKGLDICSDR